MLTCLVCGKLGDPGSVVNHGWRLAPNRVGGYTCSVMCDDVITVYDDRKKAEAKAVKAANKQKSKGNHL
jgi:hypothetical protein